MSSISRRILAIIVSFALVLSILITAINYRVFSRVIIARFEQNLRTTARHYATLVLLAIVMNNRKMLERVAQGITRNDSVIGLDVLDPEGRIIFTQGKSTSNSIKVPLLSTGFKEQLLFPEPSPKKVGELVIYYSLTPLRELLERLIVKVSIAVILLLLAVVVAVHYTISRSVLNPLMELVEAARRVGAGDLEVSIKKSSVKEIGELSNAFSEMVESLKEHQRLLEESYSTLAKQRSLAEIGKFSLAIAHEIKNPLGIIKGAVNLMRKAEVPDEVKQQMLDYIEEETMRIDRLVKDFLKLSKIKPPQCIKTDVTELLSRIIGKFKVEHPEVDIALKAPSGSVVVETDPEKVERIVSNLLRNSIEAGATEVKVEVYEEGGGWGINVMDNGEGIPEDEVDKVFMPFYTRKEGGTGLGLTIVAQEVYSLNGVIKLRSKPGEGCTFTLLFEGVCHGPDTGGR